MYSTHHLRCCSGGSALLQPRGRGLGQVWVWHGGALARLPAHARNARLLARLHALARNSVSIWGLFHLHHPPTNCTRLFSYDIANPRPLAPSLSSFYSDGTESNC